MPQVHIYMLSGRTSDQKRQLIKEMTRVMVDVAGARSERVGVVLHEVEAENWGRDGVPLSEEAAGAPISTAAP